MVFRGWAVTPIAIAIFIVAVGTTETHGFVPTSIHQHLSYGQVPARFESTLSHPSALAALVYGTDGSVVGDDVFENPDDGVTRVADEDQDNNVIESLRISVDDSSVWNKIACAFAPPPHDRLTPELVRDANPVGFTDKSIDIALAVPASVEGGAATAAANQLVRVLVTVSFPQAWAFEKDASENEKVSALMGQVKVLEGLAGDRLSQQRSSGGLTRDDPEFYEKQVIEQKWKEKLEEEPATSGDGLPQWWEAIAPPFASLELREEAKLLKKLLNEDEFEDELRALFVEHANNSSPLVYRASVASVGSSGLFLKARVAATTAKSKTALDDDDEKEAEIMATASIPYSNPPKEVTSAGQLREGVLVLVESVVPMPMPATPQVEEVSIESEGEPIKPFNEQVVEIVTELESESTETLDTEAKGTEKETTQLTEDSAKTEPNDDSKPVAAAADVPASPTVEESESKTKQSTASAPSEESSKSETQHRVLSRQQPRPPEEEAKLAAKYAAIEDLGERAFAILSDLGMV